MNDDQDGDKQSEGAEKSPTEKTIEHADSDPPRDESAHNPPNLICGMTRDRLVELLFAFAITAFTGGMWWTSSDQVAEMKLQTASIQGQLKAMQDQLTEMKTGGAETKNLITATESIAKATTGSVAQGKASLDASIEASRLDQRAWVGIVAAGNPVVKPGIPVGLEVKYVNTGKTPAFKFKADIAVRYQPINEKFIPEFTKPIMNPSTLIVLPQMDAWSDASKAKVILTQEQIDRVIAGTATLYVLGRFTYRTLNTNAGGVFCMYFQRDLTSPPGWCDTYNDVY